MYKYTLIDGQEMNRMHPDTFHIPTQEELDELEVGDYVKLGFEEEGATTERMWVLINEITGDYFEGELDNVPFNLRSIGAGAKVEFETKHILAIHKG